MPDKRSPSKFQVFNPEGGKEKVRSSAMFHAFNATMMRISFKKGNYIGSDPVKNRMSSDNPLG